MPKSKQLKDKILETTLQESNTLTPQAPATVETTSAPKKRTAKVVKETTKKKVSKPKKPALKVKRVDSEEVQETPPTDVVVIQPPADPPSVAPEKKVVTKLVVKDGVVLVEPVFNPFDD